MKNSVHPVLLKQVRPTDSAVRVLIEKLDHYQVGLYGVASCNLESADVLEKSNAFMIGAHVNGALIGIGAIKLFADYAEIKRMYVDENYRGMSVAKNMLAVLEAYAVQCAVRRVFLETGNLHHAAIRLYRQSGYQPVACFGDYRPNHVSVYFSKEVPTNTPSADSRFL